MIYAGRAFLVERLTLDMPELPEGTPTSGTSIFGRDAAHGTYVQLYYDARGVCTVCKTTMRFMMFIKHPEDYDVSKVPPALFGAMGEFVSTDPMHHLPLMRV